LRAAMRWYILIYMEKQQSGNLRRQRDAALIWESRRAEITALYINGPMSQAQLADHYGMSQQGIARALKRMGIKPKSRGRAGEQNGRYIDGTQSTIYRRMVEKTHCNRCGATDQLVVHHVDGDHTNNVVENLEVLCSPCHSSHHKQEWWNSQKAGQS
jgi:DNA-binding MarR family transcriptional regulator